MGLLEIQLPNNHQDVTNRFVAACQADERVVAAFVIFRFYQDVAPNLAKAHSITYQTDLERMMISQLEELEHESMS